MKYVPKENLVLQFQVEAAVVPSEKQGRVLEIEDKNQFCPLCPHKLGCVVKYTVGTAQKMYLSFARFFVFEKNFDYLMTFNRMCWS